MTDRDKQLNRVELHDWWQSFVDDKRTDEIVYHLGDLYDACKNMMRIIELLPTIPLSDSKKLRHTLSEIYGEMYEHMIPNHLRPLKPILNGVLSELYQDAKDRNEPGWDLPPNMSG